MINQKQYEIEAKKNWGNTAAWQEYEKKSLDKSQKQTQEDAEGLLKIISRIGSLKNLPINSKEVMAAVGELKEYITAHYYTCTDEILAGLGKMYTADERFKKNIDNAGNEGTAEFLSRAIEVFLNGRE